MFKFLTHRPLWLNILAGIILALAIFFLFLLSLKCLTRHGKSATVPSVTGKKYDEAIKLLKKAGFEVEIQDSVYVDTLPPMAVIKQMPEADEIVKANREIILIVNRFEPPLIEMPNLLNYSYRNAEMVLGNLGLKVGDTTFEPDFAKNIVRKQIYNGQIIAPGTKIRKGSVVSLVLGDGVGNKEFAVPSVIGMQFCDMKKKLEGSGVLVGAIVLDPDVTDTCSAWIYWQNPERYDEDKNLNHIRSGQTIDVRLQLNKPARKDSLDNTDHL